MKALVLMENATLRYTGVELTEEAEMVLVKVAYAGVCGSDIGRCFDGGAYHYPLIMGHEFSGVVAAGPPDCSFREGDRVAVYPLLACGGCAACRAGDCQLCSNYDYYGSRRDGGFAEYVYVPPANLVRVPDDVPLRFAAMTEPAAVAHHGVDNLQVESGSTALVVGGGPVGNFAAQWLKLAGCARVIVSDIDERKLEIAGKMGFIAVNPARENLNERVMAETGGNGADNCVEACGQPQTCRQACELAARKGKVLLMGNISGDFVLSRSQYSSLLRRELTLLGTWNSKPGDDWRATLAAMRGGLNLTPLISHEPALEDGAAIFAGIRSGREFFNKVIFRIGGEA